MFKNGLIAAVGLALSLLPTNAQMNFMTDTTAMESMMNPCCTTGPEISGTMSADTTAYEAGKPFYLAAELSFTEPWHAYYDNPGTVGMPMEVQFTVPQGFDAEGPYITPPVYHAGAYNVAYVHAKPVIVWKITPKADAANPAIFRAAITAQLCSDAGCNPPITKELSLEIAAGAAAPSPTWGNWQHQVTGLGSAPSPVSKITQTADTVTLHFEPNAAVTDAYFFSKDNSIAPDVPQQLITENGTAKLVMKRNKDDNTLYPVANPETVGKPLAGMAGLLVCKEGSWAINQAVESEPLPAVTAIPEGITALFLSLFLGGLILNLMPCVFPVIGIKIMSFVQLGGGNRSKVFLHSLAFVVGVLVSFWIISALLIIFSNLEILASQPWTQWASTLWHDAGSDTRNWAAWMQNPWMVYIILLLLLVLGLSMFGVFEIGVGATSAGQELQNKSGLTGSFFQGLFVTVVATPCSAPFLGAAMPAAMSLPGIWMTAALTFMALGLAFPYIILGAFPALVKLLPAPGAWMESLKQALSFALFAAAAWILFVYLAFLPQDAAGEGLWILIGLVIISCAFWVYGRWCRIYLSRSTRITGFIVALLLLAAGVWGSMPKPHDENGPEWETWSPSAMQEALDSGSPVYVDFTAKWCATCLANKAVAYTDEVYKLMDDAGVVLMRADKTAPNEDIDEAMRKLNRSSVPVNALYLPEGEPAVTRELLTPEYLLEFLQEHLPQEPADE